MDEKTKEAINTWQKRIRRMLPDHYDHLGIPPEVRLTFKDEFGRVRETTELRWDTTQETWILRPDLVELT